jgi:Predicted acyltransferase
VSRRWIQQRERGTPFALELILWIAKRLGRRWTRPLLYPLTGYFLLTARDQRRASRDYLQRVFGHKPRWWHIARHFHCFAATLLDRVYLLTDQHQYFDIKVHNAETLMKRVRLSQGCVLLGSHLGSFEVLRALAVKQHFPLKVLMYRAHNQVIIRLLDALDPEVAGTVIPLGEPDALLKASEYIQQGYLVGMLGDRIGASDKVTYCRFLGAETAFAAGPLLLAATVKAPVILCFGLYRGSNRYDIHFELLAEQVTLNRRHRAEETQRLMERYVERLEHYVRHTPYNWFNFYDYWRKDLSSP